MSKTRNTAAITFIIFFFFIFLFIGFGGTFALSGGLPGSSIDPSNKQRLSTYLPILGALLRGINVIFIWLIVSSPKNQKYSKIVILAISIIITAFIHVSLIKSSDPAWPRLVGGMLLEMALCIVPLVIFILIKALSKHNSEKTELEKNNK